MCFFDYLAWLALRKQGVPIDDLCFLARSKAFPGALSQLVPFNGETAASTFDLPRRDVGGVLIDRDFRHTKLP